MNWLNYLLQVNLYLILFYGFYRLLLRTETFFNLNRGYLVASAALAFFIPLMQSEWVRSWFVTEQISQTITTLYSPQVFYIQASKQAHTLTLGDFMAVFYITGILFGIARFGGNLVYLGKMMSLKTEQRDAKQAFSFFNVLFVSKDLKSRSTIMKHEFVHIRQLHSADVLLFELIAIFNWFNPVVYLYKSSIKHIHEFIADEVASNNEPSKADYAMLLFQEQFGVQAIPLTNNFFNQSLLKLRIKMLHKERSAQTAMMKYGLIAPLFMVMIVVSSATLASKELAKIENKVEKISDVNLAEIIEKPTEAVSETLLKDGIDLSEALIISPDLVGEVKRLNAFNKYLMKNLRYPFEAQKRLITGISYIGFTVKNDGKIHDIKVLTEESPLLSREVIRVLQSIKNISQLDINEPNDYVIPVNFGLEISEGNGTRNLLSTDPILRFTGRKNLGDILVMGYAEDFLGKIKGDTVKSANKESSEVFIMVEQNAEYPGGMKAFGKYLEENLKYPESAQKANHKGKVYIQFIVNTDGSTSEFSVLKSTGDNDLDNEALRVLKLVKWIPAKQSGRIVRSRFTVPINFEIAKETKVNINKKDNEEFPKLPAVIEFKSSDGTTINKDDILSSDKSKTILTELKNLVYMMDGKRISEVKLKGIDPKDIERLDVYKGEKAVMRYGEEARNGAVVITLKQK